MALAVLPSRILWCVERYGGGGMDSSTPTPTLPRCGRWRVLQGRGYSGLFLFYSTVNGFGYATGADGIGAVMTQTSNRP